MRPTASGSLRSPSGCWVPWLLLQLGQLFSQGVGLLAVYGLNVLHDRGRNSWAGDVDPGDSIQRLAPDADLEHGALLAAGRIMPIRGDVGCDRAVDTTVKTIPSPRTTCRRKGPIQGSCDYMISFRRPPVLDALCGRGRHAEHPAPGDSAASHQDRCRATRYMLAMRSTGYTGRSFTSSPLSSEAPTTRPP